MRTGSLSSIRNHIIPEIGDIPLQKLQPIHIEILCNHLQTKKCSGPKGYGADDQNTPYLSSTTIQHIHGLLKSAFNKAVEWKLIDSNPVVCSAPKRCEVEHNIWTPEMVRAALDDIDHPMLHLAVHLAFICSLRVGETVALTWDDVDFENSLIHVRKTLQRVRRESLEMLSRDDLVLEFPAKIPDKNSVLVLKKPKTAKSRRIVYLTPNLLAELMKRKQFIEKEKSFWGEEYHDFNLVFSLEDGYPVEPKLCEKWFKKWQKKTKLDFPPLIFHELRHSSATYKLLESEGDIKLVQGDLGHATAQMTADTYAHTQDKRRRDLTDKIAQEFYVNDKQEQIKDEDTLVQMLKSSPNMKKRLLQALLEDI